MRKVIEGWLERMRMGKFTDIKRPVVTTETSFQIIEYLLETESATLTEVSEELDLAESTAHRHLLTLAKHDFITKTNGRYRVGLRFLGIGTVERNHRALYQAGTGPVDQLSTSVGKRAWLSTFENDASVTLHWANDRDPLHQYSQVGQRHPLHLTAAGKAMLAMLPADEVERIITESGLPARTENSITEPAALFDELQEIRDQGFAISQGESFTRVEAIAAPIQVEGEELLGAVAVGRSFSQQDNSLEQNFAERLLETSSEIEVQLRN